MELCRDNKMRPTRLLTVQIIVDVIIWIVVGLPVLFLYLMGVPTDVGFFCDDQTLMYPHREETISTAVLLISGFIVSIVLFVLVEVLNWLETRRRRRGCCGNGHVPYYLKGYAVFLVGFVINQLFNDAIKNSVGRLRPNFFDVCQPVFNRTDCAQRFITADMYQCTTNEHSASDIRDSRQSFPSGHAQMYTFVAVFLSLYIQRRLSVNYSYILTLVLQTTLVLGAVWGGITRLHDNKHHASDVIAGYIIGALIASVVFWTLGRKVLVPRRRTRLHLNLERTSSQMEECSSKDSARSQTPLFYPHTELTNGGTSPESYTIKEPVPNRSKRMSAPAGSTSHYK